MNQQESIAGLVARALVAYDVLTALGEDVEDEWSYVNDLAGAWRARIDAVTEGRGAEDARASVIDALDRLIDLVGRIGDPHRAIDWLSTFPQVLLITLGEEP